MLVWIWTCDDGDDCRDGYINHFFKVIRHVFRSSYIVYPYFLKCVHLKQLILNGVVLNIYLCFNTKKIRNMFITHFNKWLHKKG